MGLAKECRAETWDQAMGWASGDEVPAAAPSPRSSALLFIRPGILEVPGRTGLCPILGLSDGLSVEKFPSRPHPAIELETLLPVTPRQCDASFPRLTA
jgi:hypothetical protein